MKLYDNACFELAKVFLEDAGCEDISYDAPELAWQIQQTVEEYIHLHVERWMAGKYKKVEVGK